MRRQHLRRILFLMALSLPLMAQPKYHTLIITTKDGKLPVHIGEFIERRFPDLAWKAKSSLEYYKARPELPLTACNEAEYYLLGPDDKLLHKGCLELRSPTAAAWEIAAALKRYYLDIRKLNPP